MRYVNKPHSEVVIEPTAYMTRNEWDCDGRLQFGVLFPDGSVVRFEPIIDKDDEENLTYVTEITVTGLVFSRTPEEIAFVGEVYNKYVHAIDTYLTRCVYDPVGPTIAANVEVALEFALTSQERKALQSELEQFTYIYVIRDKDTGFIKIGRSNNPFTRLRQLQRQDTLMPRPNSFFIEFYWRDYGFMEKTLHERYADKRIRGEWFNLTAEDLEAIKGSYLNTNEIFIIGE